MAAALPARLQVEHARVSLIPLTLALAGGEMALYLALRPVLGDVDSLFDFERPWWQDQTLRSLLVISLITGLAYATGMLGQRRLSENLEALAPLLPPGRHLDADAVIDRVPKGALRWGGIAAGLFGIAIIPVLGDDAARYLRAESWRFDTIWALLANAALFLGLGRLAIATIAVERVFDRDVTPHVAIDLLEIESLVVFARRGVRNAIFWFLGSSAASLLFLNFGFSWLHLAILATTMGVGTAALVRPARGIHRRIVAAKRAELTRVRERIRAHAESALATPVGGVSDASATEELPGLLAYEARISSVSTWPFDVSSLVRFGALGALAIGSWVGGALIERIVESALERAG